MQSDDDLSYPSPSTLRLDPTSPKVRQLDDTENADISKDPSENDIRPLQRKRRHSSSASPSPPRLDDAASPQVFQLCNAEDAGSSKDLGDDMRPLQPKRRKPNSAAPAKLLRRSARGQKPRKNSPRPTSLYLHCRDDEIAEAPVAEFGEWPLENAVLKRIIVDNQATFQIQFTWDCCMNDGGKGQYHIDSRDEAASASTQVGQVPSLHPTLQSRSLKTKKRRTLNQTTGKKPRGKGPGYVAKTDTKGRQYDAWKFECILDSRKCSDTSNDIEYKIKWTAPWPVTWQPALDLQDNLEEITEFHQRMPDKPGPPAWVKDATDQDASEDTAQKGKSTKARSRTGTGTKSDPRIMKNSRREKVY